MDNFIDSLQSFARREAKDIQQREFADEQRRLRNEKERLDKLHAGEVAKRKATTTRATTLNMAWAAAELLKQSGVAPMSWIRKYDHHEGATGFFRKQLKKSERSQVVLEGWPLLTWQDARSYDWRPTHTLVLTPESHTTGTLATHLAHFSRTTSGFFYGYNSERGVIDTKMTPEDILPLQTEPLSKGDMLWPRGWKLPRVASDPAFYEPLALEDFDAVRPLTEPHYGPAPDHATYNKLRIEEHIQRAIGRTIAKHFDINPRKATRRIQSSPLDQGQLAIEK